MQQETPRQSNAGGHPLPYVMRLSMQWNPAGELTLEQVDNPLPHGTLGDIGIAANVRGLVEFPPTILMQPFHQSALERQSNNQQAPIASADP